MEIEQLPPPCRLSDSDLLSRVDTVTAARSALDTWCWQAAAELETRKLAKELGAKDTVELLSSRHRRNARELRRDLKLVMALPKYEAVAAALTATSAPLSAAHAKVIIATLEKAPASAPVDGLRVAEEQLVEVAAMLTPDELHDFGLQVLARLDTDGPEPADKDPYEEEFLRLKPVEGGMKLTGFLADDHAEHLKTAVHKLAKPHKTVDGERDPRSLEKRHADALVTILDIATGATATAGVPGVPHLTVTIDFADLQSATAHKVGELVFGPNLSASAVRLLACDAKVLPIVLGSSSQPLDVGTEVRFVTGPIRWALIKRDKGCVICHAPPSNCHAHHIVHWADGGPTAITNLVLLCGAHHNAVHHGHWTVTITNGTVTVTRPAWSEPTRTNPTELIQETLNRHATPPTGPDPGGEHPGQPRPQSGPSPADGLSWLTPESVADLDPWGESGTPSAGP
ncbi:DUF222 domain-containing protein [Kribbella sp. NPDC056861]|uniref:HNH endonuclease signature motif containing protein n=1 Tax=Kribbella sp. NPDC056861 TaxID=3154857 RepID=UPI003426FA11